MSTHQTIIRAGRPWWHIDWKELAEYQDLLWLLVKRDLTAIYKQTILGPAWFVIQPLVTTLVFTIIFGKVAKISDLHRRRAAVRLLYGRHGHVELFPGLHEPER